MCQQCIRDGKLTQATADRIETFLDQWPGAEFGPAHIVLSDYNVEDGHLDACIADLLDTPASVIWLDEQVATLAFLRELRAIPESER